MCPPLFLSSLPLLPWYILSFLSPGRFLNGSYCSFEEGECSWQSITGRGLSWKRLQSPVKATRQTCPSSGSSDTAFITSRTQLRSNCEMTRLQALLSLSSVTSLKLTSNELSGLFFFHLILILNIWVLNLWAWKENTAHLDIAQACRLLWLQLIISAVTQVGLMMQF